MEFLHPVPEQDKILGQFSKKWFDFVSRFQYFHFQQNLDGTTKLSFLLHFGANTFQEIGEIHHLSSEELNRFSSYVEALENKCLFQIVITFFRYLYFNHCRKSGSWVEDFYTELKLLSEMCSFDDVAVDNHNKNHVINSLQEERVRDVFANGANLTAKDVVDICSKVETHPGASTPELFQSYLFLKNHQKQSLQKFTKTEKDFGWSFQHRWPDITQNSTLTIVPGKGSQDKTHEVQESDLVDNAGKLSSHSNVKSTPVDSLSDATSYIPNEISSSKVNFSLSTEETSNFIQLSPLERHSPNCEESTVLCSLPPSILQEERVSDVFVNGSKPTAKEVIDISSKVEKRPGASTPRLFQSYLFRKKHQKKLIQKSTNTGKDFGRSFQNRWPKFTQNSTLTIVSGKGSGYKTDEVQKSDLVDKAGKLSSYSNVKSTQMDPLSDVTSYIPKKIASLEVNFPHQTKETPIFIEHSSPVHDSPTCKESNVPHSLPPSIPLTWPGISFQKEESPKAKKKIDLEQHVTVTVAPAISSNVVSSVASVINTAITSTLTSCLPGTTSAPAADIRSDHNYSFGEGALGQHIILIHMDTKNKANDLTKESCKTFEDATEILSKDAIEIPSKDTNETPFKDAYEIPSKDANEISSKDSNEIPSKDTNEIPFKDADEIPSKNTNEIPSKDANKIPSRDAHEVSFQAYCSQQQAFLRTRSRGQFVGFYSCNFCVYRCSSKIIMEKHALREHKSLKCFVCTACNIKLPSKEQFESHVRTNHMKSEEHVCQICDMVFTCQKELLSHLQGHVQTPVSCRVCSTVCLTERLLSYHMARFHPDIDRWSCRICNSGFSDRKSLADHVIKIHKAKDQDRIWCFNCEKCGINFIDKKSSDRHKRKFHGKPEVRRFPCDHCSHICSSNVNLISHRRIHTGDKPYMCEMCGKGFAQLSSLDKHIRIHTGETPYKCQYCELAFKTSSNRLVHERKHRN